MTLGGGLRPPSDGRRSPEARSSLPPPRTRIAPAKPALERREIKRKVGMTADRQSDVVVYTDGACAGNPGPGGWAAIIIEGGDERAVSGAEPMTTNQRMELR